MDWFEYLNMIYSVANVPIPTDERIIVVEVEYVRNLFTLLDKTPPRITGIYRPIDYMTRNDNNW